MTLTPWTVVNFPTMPCFSVLSRVFKCDFYPQFNAYSTLHSLPATLLPLTTAKQTIKPHLLNQNTIKMPSYELLVVFKAMKRPELVAAIKRTAETLWTKGAVLTKLENMGSKTLPYKMRSSGKSHLKGSYFLYHFEAAPTAINHYMDFYDRDIDIIRPTIVLQSEHQPKMCTLEEELLPPAYRKDVADLLVEGKKHKKQLFKPYVLEITSKPF